MQALFSAASTVRQLQANEWYRLAALQPELGSGFPGPNQAQVFIVEQLDEIVGIFTMEQIIHIGPVWISPKIRGRGAFQKLCQLATQTFPSLRGGIFFTSNSKLAKLAQHLGFPEIKERAFKVERI